MFLDIHLNVRDNTHKGICPEKYDITWQAEVLAEHFRLSVELYGEVRAATTMRTFGVKYAQLHPDTLAVRQAFACVKTAADWMRVLDDFYSEAG